MWCVVFLQAMFRIESDCFEIFQSQFGNPRLSPFEFLLGTACWSKKQDAGILTGNAKRIFIFYDNVTCFGTNESCWNRSHLPEFFIKAPHFLLAWLLCFFTQTPRFYIFLGGDLCNTHDCLGRNNSYFGLENKGWKMSFVFLVWHPPGFFSFSDMVWRLALLGEYQELCWASKATHFEIFQSQFGNPRISPFEFLLGTASWSKKQDAGMLAGNAKRIFCDNVTCFGTNESCWNRSHLPESFIKAPHFLLAWLLCFFTQTPRFHIFLEGDLCNTHDCPGRNNSYVGLENEGWKMSFVFWVWHPPGFFSFSDMVWRLPILGMYQHKNSVKPWKQLTWCQYGQKCKKLEKRWRRQGHFVWCVVFLQCSEIESDCFEIFQSQFGNPRISPVEFLLGIIFWSKK